MAVGGDKRAVSDESGTLQPAASSSVATATSTLRRLVPGLLLVGTCVGLAFFVNHLVPSISPLVVSVVAGAVLTNLRFVPTSADAGTRFAGKRLLRLGVVLLGFQLGVDQVLSLGGPALAVVVGTVALTFFGTQWLGRRLGVSRGLSLLVATRFSICGASAIAAMSRVAHSRDASTPFSIAPVALFGTLATRP